MKRLTGLLLLILVCTWTAFATEGKLPKANKGVASLIFFYFGDSKYETLGQETTRLKLAMEDYEYRVLLKHDVVSPFWDLSEKDEKLANEKGLPTKENLIKYLKKLADDGYMIDLWIFSHGSRDGFRASLGTHGSKGSFTISDIQGLTGVGGTTGYKILPLRLVYQTNCYGSYLHQSWLNAGAKCAIGSRYVNFYPTQFGGFAKKWNKGKTVAEALEDADTAASRTLAQTYILSLAKKTNDDWGGCPFPSTVLGDHACAKKYFLFAWLADSEWQNNKSGKENMNYSSDMLIKGDRSLTKHKKPTWK